MATLSLKISLEGGRVTKTIQFDPQTTVFDACKIIRDKFAEAVQGQRKAYKCVFFVVVVGFSISLHNLIYSYKHTHSIRIWPLFIRRRQQTRCLARIGTQFGLLSIA